MTFRNLRQYLDALKKAGELVEINAPVDVELELPEIHRRVIAAGGPTLLFRSIKGKKFPVVTNMFGTKKRVDLAFGARPKDLIRTAAALPHTALPPSIKALWGARHLAKEALTIGFRRTKKAPVLAEMINPMDLRALPATKSWYEDGGPFLTLPLVHTRLADSVLSPGKADNLGIYRVQIFSDKEAGMHFQIGKGGGFHLAEAEARGVALPVNIYLGGPPALILAAIAPLPENVPELLLASLILGERLTRAKVKESPLQVMGEAEFCIVGQVPPKIRRPEGPFGDHYGYYSLVHDYPVFRPQAIYHRRDAIFPATVVGKPRQEDFFLGDYLQELLLPLAKLVMPSVDDLWSYGETGFHSLASAVLKERYGKEMLATAFRILGEGQLSLTKFLLGVDRPMNLRHFPTVLTYILERVRWENDLYIFGGTAMDSLDYTGPVINKGSKGVLLGVGEPKRSLPREFHGSVPDNLIRDVKVYSPGCLVLEVASYAKEKDCVEKIVRLPQLKDWPLLVAVDQAKRATVHDSAFLWTTFTRFDPASDIYSGDKKIESNRIIFSGPILIDARMKPSYPAELFCDEDTQKLVSRRWQEYFPNRNVEMGDGDGVSR